jgi:hypothetical protein
MLVLDVDRAELAKLTVTVGASDDDGDIEHWQHAISSFRRTHMNREVALDQAQVLRGSLCENNLDVDEDRDVVPEPSPAGLHSGDSTE